MDEFRQWFRDNFDIANEHVEELIEATFDFVAAGGRLGLAIKKVVDSDLGENPENARLYAEVEGVENPVILGEKLEEASLKEEE